MSLKEKAKKLKEDIPAVFIALNDNESVGNISLYGKFCVPMLLAVKRKPNRQ